MRVRLSTTYLTASGLGATLAFVSILVASAPAEASSDAKLMKGPEGTYARTCGYCHGSNVGPPILGRGVPPEATVAITRTGQGAMPAFRPTEINDAELAALGAWISTSKASAKDHGK